MKLGIIGCGKMGTALVGGVIRSGTATPDRILGYDPHGPALAAFTHATAASATEDLADLAGCDTLILATKPQQAATALAALAAAGPQPALLLSIAAGLTLDWLEKNTPAPLRVIRSMPNTPALVGEGAAAFSLGTRATRDDAATARKILGSVGLAIEVPEPLLDAVTGLSGSGPAYVYLAIEALADGGVRNGLPRADALKLAAQTLRGAATMVLETGQHPGELKDMVTSPAGTTIAGLATLESRGFRAALIEAVTAATRRSQELGRA